MTTIRRPCRAPVVPTSAPIVCPSCKRAVGEPRTSGVTKIPRPVFVRTDGLLQCQCPSCGTDVVLPYERRHG